MNKEQIAEIIADGRIDANEVSEIRADIFADGKIDDDEIRILAELNEGTSDNDPAWEELMKESFAAWALEDGTIDEEEGNLIASLFSSDGIIDDTEAAVVLHLNANATKIESPAFVALFDSLQ